MVVDKQARLSIFLLILRASVEYGGVGVPLYIVNLGVVGQKGINDFKHEVLYFGISEVEGYLRATSSGNDVATVGL